MIIAVSQAVCDGCARRVGGDDYPADWVAGTVNGIAGHYCSQACLERTLCPLPLGIVESDAEMLSLIALGYANKEIAWRLSLAEPTIKNRLTKVFARLGASDRCQAILAAHAEGIINLHQLALRFAGRQA